MPAKPILIVNTEFEARHGTLVAAAHGIGRVTAPNQSAYTFTGTNSFLIGDGDGIALVDPGPDDAAHLAALVRAVGGRRVSAILLTHTHKDHSALARKAAEQFDAPIWFGGQHRLSRPLKQGERNVIEGSCDWDLVPDRELEDGETIEFGGVALEVITTPGHCANHLAFGVVGSSLLLSGDHVMGWSSTLVPVPDGSMADYLASLEKLLARDYAQYLPAHGGAIEDGKTYAQQLRDHRQGRNDQILQALETGPLSADALRDRIYPDLPEQNLPAAAMTLQAHLEYLMDKGDVAALKDDALFRLAQA